jgi:hypothetical protein
MKAEHRKELNTNTLAAGMGRLVQTIKKKPERRTVLWILLGLGVVLVPVLFFTLRSVGRNRDAGLWAKLDGDQKGLFELIQVYPRTKQGQAARFQYAWLLLWEAGIKELPKPPDPRDKDRGGPVENIKAAKELYEGLANEVEDPTLAAEAWYHIGIAEESLAVNPDWNFADPKADDPVKKALESAIQYYKKVVADYEKTAYADEARARLKLLQGKERAEIEEQYRRLRTELFITRFRAPQRQFEDLQRLLGKKE